MENRTYRTCQPAGQASGRRPGGQNGGIELPIAPPGSPPVETVDPNAGIQLPIAPPGSPPVETVDPNAGIELPVAPPDSPPVAPLNPGGCTQCLPVFPIFPIFPILPPSSGSSACQVRFLHAAANLPQVNIFVGSRQLVAGMAFENISAYAQVADGFWTVTVTSYTYPRQGYLRKTMAFKGGDAVTIALVNGPGGTVDLVSFSDAPCQNRPAGLSCLRVANLSYGSNPLDMVLYDGKVVFSDVSFKTATGFKTIRPGRYGFYVADTTAQPISLSADIEPSGSESLRAQVPGFGSLSPLLSFYLDVEPNLVYTVYLLGYVNGSPSLRAVTTALE